MAYQSIPPGLQGLDPTNWVTNRWYDLKRANPALTDAFYMKIGAVPGGYSTGAALSGDASVEGGGLAAAAGNVRAFSGSVYQTPKTGNWGLVLQAKLAVPTGGRTSQVGLFNTTFSHAVTISTDFATSATNFVLRIVGAGTTAAATTIAATTTINNYMLIGNGTAVTAYVNGVSGLAQSTLTNLTDEPMEPATFNTNANDGIVYKILVGYVSPT